VSLKDKNKELLQKKIEISKQIEKAREEEKSKLSDLKNELFEK
jgi:hypothetical protein